MPVGAYGELSNVAAAARQAAAPATHGARLRVFAGALAAVLVPGRIDGHRLAAAAGLSVAS